MSSIQDSAMHIWVNGETITQDKLEQNRKVFETAINDNQSQISAQYTNTQIDAKVNTAASTTKVVQTGTVFPSSGLVDGQEFYRDDLHIMYIYDAALNKWVDRGSIASQGFRNLLDPSKQSFTRASNATRKDLTPVPYNVLREEQGRFGQGAFIEESTTEIVQNNDFEVFTGTATVFSDPLTSGTAWTTVGGSFTYSASGATSGAAGAVITAGNNAWKPLTGSNGTALSLTAQATFTTQATLTGNGGLIELFQSSGNNYYANIDGTNGKFWLVKTVGGTATNLASVAQTLSTSTAYTITLSITPSGGLTAKLYSGTGTGGTLLQTLTATDTSLTGGFLIGVGGDTGVIIKNAQVTAPFADMWTPGGNDARVAWALTSTSPISGSYSLSAVAPAGITGWCNTPNLNISASLSYTTSGFATSNGTGTQINTNWYNGAIYLSQSTIGQANSTLSRLTGTATSPSTANQVNVNLIVGAGATAVFDAIQLEQKAYATTYVRNDSTSASATRNADSLSYTLSNPLPNRWFKAYVFRPAYASSALPNRDFMIERVNNLSGSLRYKILWRQSDGKIHFIKSPDGTTLNDNASATITFNANDYVYVFVLDDPTTAGNTQLWVGVNNGALTQTTLVNTTSITDAQIVYTGCDSSTGIELNAAIDFPILTDIIPTSDQVQALYQASDWGGDRNYPDTSSLKMPNKAIVHTVGNGGVSVESPNSWAFLSGKSNAYLAGNAYFDGTNWNRFDTTQPAQMIQTNAGYAPLVASSPAGANPINSWATSYNLLQALSGGFMVINQPNVNVPTPASTGWQRCATVSFPTVFPNACDNVIACFYSGASVVGNMQINTFNKNGFDVYANVITANNAFQICYIAFGH